ncbi:MAG: diguanylate cyclase, partial [Candidatus Eremiobacteraeota bacterium]|nr:diguanylate cyclase [Candidatus Eremiobacteraeota bacterium]
LAVLEEGLRAAEERAERYRRLAAGSVEMESVHSEELASAQRRVEQLEARVRELESESAEELTEARNWVSELEARVAELEADSEGHLDSDQLEAARFRIAELEAQLAESSPQEGGPELEALRFRVAELEARQAELSQAEALAAQLEEARARIDTLQAQASGGEPELIEALERIRELESTAAAATSLSAELEAAREQVEALERENEELADHSRRRTAELESQMAVALEAAAARLAEMETNLNGGDGQALEEACARVVELETQCEQLKSYRELSEQLQARLEELEAGQEDSWDRQALEQARSRIAELEQRLAQADQPSAAHHELEEELEEARRRADDAENRVLELEEHLLEMRNEQAPAAESDEVAELRSRAEQAETRLMALASEVNPGDTDTSQIIDQLEQRAAQAELRSAELERELEDKRSQMPDRETQKLAYADRLTGLPNFNILQQYINLTFEKVSGGEGAMALLVVDLDRFRVVNDTLGHRAGDDLLRRVAKVLQTITKKADYALARRGEDEFLLVAHLESVENDVAQVTALARGLGHSILTELAKPFELSGQTIHVTVSIGISLYPGEARTAQEMLEEADCAMYRAKELGRGRVCFYTAEMHQAQKRRLVLENELRRALDQNEFLVYYQPIIDLHSGKLAGLEA